jgi:predicted dehydrogenase
MEPLKNELGDFLNAIEQHKEPLVSGKEGVVNLEIAEAAMLSANEGKRVLMG